MSGIVVDGARPAVEWVTSLPAEWRVIESERLILLCLACDAYKLESAPGYEAVAEWTGMKRSSCAEILSRLCKPTERRPALVERISVRGRRRTIWRLLVGSEPSGHAGQLNRPAPQDGCDPEPSGTTGRLEDEPPPVNRPATPDSSEPNRRRTVGEPSANRPATPDAPLALTPKPKPQEPPATADADGDESDELPLGIEVPQPSPHPTQVLVGVYAEVISENGGTFTETRRKQVAGGASRLVKSGLELDVLIPAFRRAAHAGTLDFDRQLAAPKGFVNGAARSGPRPADGNNDHWAKPGAGFFSEQNRSRTA